MEKENYGRVSAEYWDAQRQCFEAAPTILTALGFTEWKRLPRVISLVGAGGKTSTMYDLAEELAGQGARVLITTSTHIAKPVQYEMAVTEKLEELDLEGLLRGKQRVILAAGKQDEAPGCEWKLTMPEDLGEEAVMEKLLSWFDVILIEADGSKRLPMKIPSETEPVLIPQTNLVIACMGLTAGNQPFGDACFRFATHGTWLKRDIHDQIRAADMASVLADERGSKKEVGKRHYRILLNQADTEQERKLAREIILALPRNLQEGVCLTRRKESADSRPAQASDRSGRTELSEGKKVLIRGSGDLASGIALRLHRAGFQILMTEISVPTTVRRTVAFSPAVYKGHMQVEDVTGVLCANVKEAKKEILEGRIAILVDEKAQSLYEFQPDVVVDAILAKKNLGTTIHDADFVVGVGPGFTAGVDCHCVVETKRGHYLGRCIWEGSAIANTGIPGLIGGYGLERLIKAPADGIFKGTVEIGAEVKRGDIVGYVGDIPVAVQIDGVVRGLLQDGVEVTKGMKSGDVDPRCAVAHCFTVSDKATAIGGGVLEAILNHQCSPHAHMPIAMVLLAAGDSRRFGGNKLLTEVDGSLMYRHVAEKVKTLPEDFFAKRIVVSQYDEILRDLKQEGFEVIQNQNSALGISHSIHLALEQIPDHYAVCFSVCDQPWLSCDTIARLVTAFRKSSKGMACVTCEGVHGNPVIFAPQYRKELLSLCGDVGGKRVLRAYLEDAVFVSANDARELADVDEKSQLCYNRND